jgi:hypothetical protein
VHPCITAIVAIAGLIGMSGTALAAQMQTPQTPIRTLVLAAEPTKVFGQYRRITNPVLQSGDQIHLYGEPADFGWQPGADVARFNIVATVEIRRANGQITAKGGQPLPLHYEAASRPENFFFSLSARVAGGVGAYNFVVRLRDVASGQTVERVFPFALAHERQDLPANKPLTSQTTRPATTSETASRAPCKQYFPQIGEMLAVDCAP